MTTATSTSPAPAPSLARWLAVLGRQTDVIWAGVVVLIVAMMIIPMPPFLLDLLLALNISLAITILLVAMYVDEPLEFNIFPSLLLIVTLFRLALNISSTRLILLHGQAGRIIAAFGDFVVGGNYVVGLVVFILLMVIQFVVITAGAGRVAEVAARFTLDAMPGKQMAIDADLNAGLISEEEARARREKIAREADFYGAMDGASKFVKGDAVAGIVITLINIIGGLIVGMVQLKMSAGEAAQTFTLLTVGDGLVSQIPSLIVSTATGIIVTRARSENHMGQDVFQQIAMNPRALAIVSGLLAAFALVPGLPFLPFVALSGAAGASSYFLSRKALAPPTDKALEASAEGKPAAALPQGQSEADAKDQPDVRSLLRVDALELEIGFGLVPLIDPARGGDLLDRVNYVRRQIAAELGFIVPKIRIRDNLRLGPNQYTIKLRGEEVSKGQIQPQHLLAMPGPGVTGTIEGIETTEPVFGLQAYWITPDQRSRAEMLGYTVVEPPSVIITHLTEIIRQYAADLLGRQEVQELLDNLQEDYPAIVNEVQNNPGLGTVQRVLQALLREHVPIRDLVVILEAIADHAGEVQDPELLAEQIRGYIGRTIANRYRAFDGALHVFTLAPTLEEEIAQAVQQTAKGPTLVLPPDRAQAILMAIARQMEAMAAQSFDPVLLTGQRIRLALRRFTVRSLPTLAILGFNEIPPEIDVRVEGTVQA